MKKLIALVMSVTLITTTLSSLTAKAAPSFSTASDNAYTWLKTQQDATGSGNGLVDSFEDNYADGSPIQITYTYDEAVATIAFLVKGDTVRAKKVLDRMKSLQASDGSWVNSYYWNYYGEEIRKHVGPVMWMAIAVMNYEKITGDTTTYHDMALKAIDWCLQFQTPANGAISGGQTTWDVANTWTNEVWSSTEHNQDAYNTLLYFANTTPSKAITYNTSASKVKSFLDNTAWDGAHNRFYGGFKNNTGLIDPNVPLDVNPWGVLTLGLKGTHDYSSSLNYVENANGNLGTLSNPKYVHTLTYDNAGNTMTAYDFDWQSANGTADIWFEGSSFMSCAYYMAGNTTKADSIISELIKKQGTSGKSLGGIPYSLKGTNNSYWTMAQTNCISSTGWLIMAIARWNPFTGTALKGDVTPITQTAAPTFSLAAGTYTGTQTVNISSSTNGATIKYTTDGSTPTSSSPTYSGPITISSTTTLKAYALSSGKSDSSVTTAVYTINKPTSDYSVGVTKVNSNTAKIWFKSNVNSAWVDVHYILNNAGQLNYRMTYNGSTGNWEQTITGLKTGDVIKYNFTYEKSSAGYDSPSLNFSF